MGKCPWGIASIAESKLITPIQLMEILIGIEVNPTKKCWLPGDPDLVKVLKGKYAIEKPVGFEFATT